MSKLHKFSVRIVGGCVSVLILWRQCCALCTSIFCGRRRVFIW